jgi:hypothetical protein
MATSATYGVAKYGDSQYGIVFVTSDAGSYTITGYDASFRYDHAIQAAAGAYVLTGSDASLTVSHILTGDAGAYALTGYSTTLIHNEVIYAGSWAFNLTGYDAGLTTAHLLAADAGAYALTGGDAALTKDSVLSANAGSYALTGNDATLDYQSLAVTQTTGGLPPKKAKNRIKKSQREEIEAVVREAFDKMDGTYVPEPLVAEVQKEVKREIKKVDLGEYEYAMAQINALLLSAMLKIQEYESEMDDEESLLMLL